MALTDETDVVRTEEMLLNVGPQHPSTHGVFRMVVKISGETILEAEPVIGYLHRGTEKLAENLQYTQIIPYTDRLDYVSAMLNNYSLVHTVEEALGIAIPDRAEYIRVITMELNRLASHLIFFGTYLLDLGAMTPFLYAFEEREKIIDMFNELCGARITFNYMRIGGVKYDTPPGWLEQVDAFVKRMKGEMVKYRNLVTGNEIFLARVRGVGKYTTEQALGHGMSGINLRCTGYNWDLRKKKPYSIYDRFDWEVPLGKNGDCWDRYILHMEEMEQSLRIVEQALQQIQPGPVLAKVPKLIRVPAGEYYSGIEGTRGELGFYIVSDGKDKPYRLKIRRPSFENLQILPIILKGVPVGDMVAILGSIDPVLGEVGA